MRELVLLEGANLQKQKFKFKKKTFIRLYSLREHIFSSAQPYFKSKQLLTHIGSSHFISNFIYIKLLVVYIDFSRVNEKRGKDISYLNARFSWARG